MAIQFGFFLPLIIYFAIFKFIFKKLQNRELLQASFAIGYLVSGFFHYNGRHFFYWVELAIIFHYVFYESKIMTSPRVRSSYNEDPALVC
jgi:hypothetical protein